jgi:hypothetical protein
VEFICEEEKRIELMKGRKRKSGEWTETRREGEEERGGRRERKRISN